MILVLHAFNAVYYHKFATLVFEENIILILEHHKCFFFKPNGKFLLQHIRRLGDEI
jgi:hypothetical protein